MSTTEQLLRQFASLSPTLQVAARYVVDHPDEVAVESMRTLAERAQARPATFVRLAQHLGYGGWAELRVALISDRGLGGVGYGQRAHSLARRSRHDDLVEELHSALARNLDQTFADASKRLPQAARLLRKAAAVHIAGYRASAAVAYSLFYGYRLFRQSVHLLDGAHGGLDWQMRALARDDAVVLISFAPYSSETMRVLDAAKAVAAKVVALTDSQASPLALAADLSLLFSPQSPSFFPSITAAIAVVESLLELLVAAEGPTVAAAMDQAEQAMFASGAYLSPPARRRS